MSSTTTQALESLTRHSTHLKEQILARPILSSTLAVFASSYIAAKLYHVSLRRRISKHIPAINDSCRQASVDVKELESLPDQLLTNPRAYRIVHDKCVSVIPGPAIGLMLVRNEPVELRDVFTRMLRGNMRGFAGTVQGWAVWMGMGTTGRRTFDARYIDACGFEVGNQVCGMWEVVRREPLKVEFELRVPEEERGSSVAKQLGDVQGLLVMSLRMRGDGAVLATENVQFVRRQSGVRLPLEGSMAKWLHEIAAWRLLLKASKFLRDEAEERR